MERKNMTIGLFGFGCVGFGLFEVLNKTPYLTVSIKRICVKNPGKARQIPNNNFVYDKHVLLDDPDIDLIIELINDSAVAFEIVSKAMKNGKHVISANKKMIAENFAKLMALQQQYKVSFLYEAACCASMPVIRNLEEYFDTNRLNSLAGIVNGSTNYILTQVFSEGMGYDQALLKATQMGYVEVDPSLDTSGIDSKYKLIILNAHGFGYVSKPEDIFNTGIDNLGHVELNYARQNGLKIKLVAYSCLTSANAFTTFVMPKFVSPNQILYHVDNEFNIVTLNFDFSGEQSIVGKGAGAHPTASAVVGDISALTFNYRYRYSKITNEKPDETDETFLLKVMMSYRGGENKALNASFEHIQTSKIDDGFTCIIGIITLKKLKQLSKVKKKISLILIETISETR